MVKQHSNFSCPICNNDMFFYLKGRDFLYKTKKFFFKIYKCKYCALEQILPSPTAVEIASFYPKNYYSYNIKKSSRTLFIKIREKILDLSYNNNSPRDIYYFLALSLKQFFEGLPLKHIGKKRFLDVGCGDGYNLDIMSKYGWTTTGFEFGKIRKKRNIYYGQDFTDVAFDKKKFDYIRIWHVLEHVLNPNEFMTKLSSVLSNEGQITLGLPNTKSLLAKVFGKYWFNRDVPRHLFNFNILNLKILCKKNNLKITKIKYLSQGGLLGSIQHFVNANYNFKINLFGNFFLFTLFYPIDIICNFFKISDCISITVTKSGIS